MAWKRLSLLVLVVLASGLIAAGCGDDDEGDGGDGATSPAEISIEAPTDISVPTEEGTEAQEQAEEQLEKLYDDCIASLEQIPEAQREQARQGCEALKPE